MTLNPGFNQLHLKIATEGTGNRGERCDFLPRRLYFQLWQIAYVTHTFICIFHNIYDKVHLGYFKEQLSLLVISSGIALIVLSLKLSKKNNHVGTTQAVQ